MRPGDCWDIPEGMNVQNIRVTCSMMNKRTGTKLVVRTDPDTAAKVVVCLPADE
jgi:hypothetical protein